MTILLLCLESRSGDCAEVRPSSPAAPGTRPPPSSCALGGSRWWRGRSRRPTHFGPHHCPPPGKSCGPEPAGGQPSRRGEERSGALAAVAAGGQFGSRGGGAPAAAAEPSALAGVANSTCTVKEKGLFVRSSADLTVPHCRRSMSWRRGGGRRVRGAGERRACCPPLGLCAPLSAAPSSPAFLRK